MFPFNKNFFQFPGEQKIVNMKSPNGGHYRFSTNSMDEKTFNEYQQKLEHAIKNNNQEEFDKIWNEMTGKSGFSLNMELDFSKWENTFGKWFENSTFFNNKKGLFPEFIKPQTLTHTNIDDEIKMHEEKINELKQRKEELDKKKQKSDIEKEINDLRQLLDEKLDVFSKNLDNEEMKKQLTDELTEISQNIKSKEKELENLS